MSAVFILGILGGGDFPPPKLTIFPNGWKNKLKINHGNFLVMDNKHTKLFVIK